VLSADGKELASFKRANREWVKLADISPHVVAALVATEDHRFYQHHGIDLRRTAAAALRTVSGDLQGGSTITQQLARNLYPESIGRAASLTRKLKEAITALKIEAVYSKDEILESYLNTVPFLYNAHGIEMAARTYFDKSAQTLDVLESATLIGMLKGTSYYNPVLNPERAVQRRNIVLAQLVKHNKLDEKNLPALKKMPLKVDFERQSEPLGPAPHFTQQMRRWLIEWADRNDYNIYTDGLVVHTTIDSRLQAAANQAVVNQGNRLQPTVDAQWRSGWNPKKDVVLAFMRESAGYRSARESGLNEADALKQLQADSTAMAKLRQSKTRLQAGFLALDPVNGHVKAWVGSRDFETDQFDHVQQAKRQPGSTFKPFVYGAAFEGGARATDVMMDHAVEIRLDQKTVWRPSDGVAPSGQPMALRDGLAYSKNTITAQLMQSVGPARVAKLARAMGVRQSKLDEVLSLALGTSPVTLKEMVSAYGSIANGGSYVAPVLVTRVTGKNGAVLEEFAAPAAEPAMSRAGADTLLDAMRGVVDKGTATGIRSRYGIQADVAGKTGTTQDNTDGWFILMHPQLVAGAWVGFNDNRVRMGDSWGQGARSALPVVGEFFQQAFKLRSIDANARFAAPRETRLLTAEIPLESEEFANAPADLPTAEWAQPSANAALPAVLPTYNATDPLPQGLSVPQNSARAQDAAPQTTTRQAPVLQPPAPGTAQPQLVYFGQPPATVIEVRPADAPQRARPERTEPAEAE
ncbi:MAG: transglycosylase domain-containing protein, partial [Pseudomonadota bacterium]